MTKATLQDAAEVIAGTGATLQDAAQAIVDGWTPGGGDISKNTVINKADVLPEASADNVGQVYQYSGVTDETYTHGYIYENKKTATYTGTVAFEPATLSGTTVACSGDDFANFLTESGVEPLSVVSGTMTYDAAGSLWVLVGKNSSDETVLSFQEYQEDYEDFGFTFTGTPQDGDVITFACSIEEASASYAWNRIDVQPAPVIPDPLPDQTGNAGKFLTTDGTDASWSDAPFIQKDPNKRGVCISSYVQSFTTQLNSLNIAIIGSASYSNIRLGQNSVAIAGQIDNNAPTNIWGVLIGSYGKATGKGSVALGSGAEATADGAIQISSKCQSTFGYNVATNSDANTLKVANGNGNYEMMSADGTIPTDRLTKVNTTITLAAADWSSNSQTVSVTGITATGVVIVSPDPTDQADYTAAGIICSAQSADSLTFTCDSTPANDIDVVVVML